MRRLLRSTILAMVSATVALACSDDPSASPPTLILLQRATPQKKRARGTGVEDSQRVPVTVPRVIDLGHVSDGEDVSFTLPPHALGFNVVVEADERTATEALGIEAIRGPSGAFVHAGYMPSGGNHVTSAAAASFGAITSASVPQSESSEANPPKAGRWTVRFGTKAPMSDAGAGAVPTLAQPPAPKHNAWVTIQMGTPTGFAGGRLDLVVYVPAGLEVDGRKLEVAGAATDDRIRVRLAVFFATLADLFHIDRGEVTFTGTSSAFRHVDSVDKLVAAFSASRGVADTQALHLMLTNAIEYTGENGGIVAAWGLAPGIPGAANRSGTAMSGIVVAVGETPAVGDGRTMAHEAGHFFGLNHTTEYVGTMSDPLADTPTCTALALPGADYSALESCPDRLNVMFPALINPESAMAFASEAQRRIVRGSPVYKAYAVGGATTDTTTDTTTEASAAERTPLSPRLEPYALASTSLAKSGRPLSAVERALEASLCPHGQGLAGAGRVGALFRATDEAAIAELRHAATDADLPTMMRRQAAAALRSLGR